MDMLSGEARDYLVELYNQTEGDVTRQISMHDVGLTLGLDKHKAGSLGEELIVEGLAELRTLAGGISITSQGLEILQSAGYITPTVKGGLQLSEGVVLVEGDRKNIEQVIVKIRQAVLQKTASLPDLEEMVVDLKTLEVHLLSPKPKTEIVRAILRSLRTSLKKLGLNEIAQTLNGVIE